MIDATSAIAASLATSQANLSLLAVRMAAENQRQIADMLAATVTQAASSPPNLGNRVDTYA